MKYGVFTNGRTTTYYGNDATAALAWMSMLTAISQSDAEKKVLKAAGSFQLALLDSMSKQGFIEPEKYIEFYFKADLKHSDTQGYATESRKALPFLGAVEDAVRSTFR